MVIVLTAWLLTGVSGVTDTGDTLAQLRHSELQERLAQTEAKRVQLELQMAQARHAMQQLQPTVTLSHIEQELAQAQLVSVVTDASGSLVTLRYRGDLIRLQAEQQGAYGLLAEVHPDKVRLKQLGHFRDLPVTEHW